MTKPLFKASEDWSFALIQKVYDEIKLIAEEELKLDYYPNQIEIISSEQMLDAYSSIGMPLMYNHWSFGKHFITEEMKYRKGWQGLAYEIVINSSPTIAYLMEENTMTMQALVIAHACFGHNAFFKNNYLFRQWTDASAILDYMQFAKNYILKCEEKYGVDAVEEILDSCHALQNLGVDRYRRPGKLSITKEKERQREREEYLRKQINDLWRTVPTKEKNKEDENIRFPAEPQENLLYFLEKNSPILEPWQREIVRIVRKIAQYFYPQKQTQIMNEGFATFTHYYIMNRLWEKGTIDDGVITEFLTSHTNVVYQPPFDAKHYSGINPYALGFAMFQDIKRICENPTEEDKEWFPDVAGSSWLETVHYAMENFRDESFIRQFLSPKIIRDWRLFSVHDNSNEDYYIVEAIHNDSGYKTIRRNLAKSRNIARLDPDIQVYNVNLRGDRTLHLRYHMYDGVPLEEKSLAETLKHVARLWGYQVVMTQEDHDTGRVTELQKASGEWTHKQ